MLVPHAEPRLHLQRQRLRSHDGHVRHGWLRRSWLLAAAGLCCDRDSARGVLRVHLGSLRLGRSLSHDRLLHGLLRRGAGQPFVELPLLRARIRGRRRMHAHPGRLRARHRLLRSHLHEKVATARCRDHDRLKALRRPRNLLRRRPRNLLRRRPRHLLLLQRRHRHLLRRHLLLRRRAWQRRHARRLLRKHPLLHRHLWRRCVLWHRVRRRNRPGLLSDHALRCHSLCSTVWLIDNYRVRRRRARLLNDPALRRHRVEWQRLRHRRVR